MAKPKGSKKGASKKGAGKKGAGKKGAARKAATKKASTTKGGAKKGSAKKAASKKTGAKKAGAKKASARGIPRRISSSVRAAIREGLQALGPTAGVTIAAEEPSTNECIIWRDSSFRERVVLAVAAWALEHPSSISMTDTLGSLAKGVPWEDGPGQQARLVQAVNQADVFAPFSTSRMAAPSTQHPASTTVAGWEKIVWENQTPRTPCFPKIPS